MTPEESPAVSSGRVLAHDDPRHGSTAGHNAGCRCTPCRDAKLRYDKRRRWEASRGHQRLVPARGARRRLRALQALGHSFPAIARAAGESERTITDICYRSQRIRPETHHAIAMAYEALCMTVATSRFAERSRRAAARKGWAPPLAWDDIDTDDEPTGLDFCGRQGCTAAAYAHGLCQPHYRNGRGRIGGDIDPMKVERVLAGEWRLPTSVPEKTEVARRWVEAGRSLRSLAKASGWKVERYLRLEEAA